MAKNQKDVESTDAVESTTDVVVEPTKKEQKKVAYITIKELVDAQEDTKYREALQLVRPSLYGMQSPGSQSKFIALMLTQNEVHENDIFIELKMGRKEAYGNIKKQLKKAQPDKRVWISFEPSTGIYKVEGVGAEPPKNWKGYVPIETEAIELL